MEKKTMGSFLTALRRASGMTQKELAEKLNVSDKSVSRWERDDGAPDLALLPVIAEIFGVTCDELLRGERAAAGEGGSMPPFSQKAEQQRRRLLAVSRSKFRSHSYLSLALSAAGFLVATACNVALSRALLGLFLGAVFFVAAVAVEAWQVNAAFLAVDGEEDEEVDAFRCAVVRGAARIYGVTWVLFALTLPLLLAFWPAKLYGTLYGLAVSPAAIGVSMPLWQWFVVLLAALAVWAAARNFILPRLLKKGVYQLDEGKAEAFRRNCRLQRITVLALCAALGLSAFVNSALTGFGDAARLAKGTEYTSMDAFKTYMEKYDWSNYYEDDVFQPSEYYVESEYPTKMGDTFYRPSGLAFDDGYERGEVLKDDRGYVLCSFMWRNHKVVDWKLGAGEDGLPVTVYTQDDIRAAHRKAEAVDKVFYGVYALEAAAAVVFYLRKRAKA